MGRFLTLLLMMILGAVAVRTQVPKGPNFTRGSVNGAGWIQASHGEKVSYVNGAMDGYRQGVCGVSVTTEHIVRDPKTHKLVKLPRQGNCDNGDLPAWVYRSKTGDPVKEIDSFYQDGANISIPVFIAFVYSEMKLSGSTKQELDSYLALARLL